METKPTKTTKPTTARTPIVKRSGDSQDARRWCREQVRSLGGYRSHSSYVAAPRPGAVIAAQAQIRRLSKTVRGWEKGEEARKKAYERAAEKARALVVRAFYTGSSVAEVLALMDAYRAKWERP